MRDARGAYVHEENALRSGYIVNSMAWERQRRKKRKERKIKGGRDRDDEAKEEKVKAEVVAGERERENS